MGQSNVKERIARRVAEELHDGDVVNLGIGLPSLVSNYIPDGVEIVLHGENGILGMGELSDGADSDYTVQNAGAQFIRHQPGAMYMNSAMSFVIIRGGHIDATVLGAFQVDKDGNLANWIIPGGKISGMGGAMDLSVGAKKVIVATTHTNRGEPKIVEKCTLPLTAVGVVDMIVTEMGVFQKTDTGLILTERFEDYSLNMIRENTACEFTVSEDLKTLTI